jgi:hypothetical protein
MPAVHRFIENVSAVAAETSHLLLNLGAGIYHQCVVAVFPELIALCERAGYALAAGFYGVLPQDLGLGGWQLAVPVNYPFLSGIECAH